MDQVGSRIKRERTMRGWSQRDLAKKAKITAETISTIETGQHEPRPSTLRKLAEAFELEVRDLFEEPALTGKAKASETGPSRDEVQEPEGFDLPELKAVRERRSMSRDELAFRTGVPAVDIAEFEEGTRRADMDTVQLLAFTLGTFSAELIFPREQFEAFKAEDKRQNRRIAEELAKRSPQEVEDDTPAMRKLRDAFVREDERRKRERPETA